MTNKKQEKATTKKQGKTTNKNEKEWLKSILITGFFIIVFVCAFFGMDVEKNTPMQFVDKMLSWNIVETASSQAKQVREAITPIQKLAWGLSDITIDWSKINDASSITEKLSKLNELKEAYDELKNADAVKNLIGDKEDVDEEKISNLISSESNFVDDSIKLYNFILNNQEAFFYNVDGSLDVTEDARLWFDDLLLNRVASHANVKSAESLYEGIAE